MESFRREFLLMRIINGYLKYDNRGEKLVIRSPSLPLLYDAAEIYAKIYQLSLEEGIMTDDDIRNHLIGLGIWDDEKEKQLNDILPKHIDYWKEELARAVYNSSKRENVRKYLKVAKDEYSRLTDIRHSYDYVTCHGVANYAKLQFIVDHCTYKGNKRYNWDKVSAYTVMQYYQSNIISEESIREISHTHPWDITWSVGKKIGNVFNKPAIQLNFDEQRLVMWSMLYDNVREQPDSPSDEILNDDDMLDGWLIIKRKERQNAGDGKVSTNEKINNAQEVFIPASNADDARKVDSLNSQYSRAIKKQRFAVLQKRGEITEANLPDVKQELLMKMNQKVRG